MNYKPGTLYLSDNLPVLRGMDSGTVDLIYLDPPFNSKREYRAPIGSKAEGQKFDDTWRWDELDVRWLGEIARRSPALAAVVEAARLTQGDGTAAYLAFIGIRLLEMQRVLKPTGSIYIHCDPTANAYLRVAMDAVFGKGHFRNEIAWCYSTGGASKRRFAQKHDVLIAYGGPDAIFNTQRVPYTSAMSRDPKHAHKFHPDGKIMLDWWEDIAPLNPQAKERTGWATQKPLALLQRIIRASSNPGDVVLDPFAGCATALVAAAMEGRRWVGIEACEAANDILQVRLSEADMGELGAGAAKARVCRRPPKRTDVDSDEPRRGSKPWRTRENVDFLYGRQRGDCTGCTRHYQAKDFAVDHVVPRAAGGSNELDNLQLLCGHCNSIKGDRDMDYLRARLAELERERLATLGAAA